MNFIHLRSKSSDGTPATKSGTTIAWRRVATKAIEIGVAKCHYNDNFCRRIGRNIAEGRLLAGKSFIIDIENFEQLSWRQIRERIVSEALNLK
jgi:hypothetical protein